MTDSELLADNIRNYLESGVDLLLTDDDCKTIIKALEKQKTGHWIYIDNSRVNGLKICKCSNCKKKNYGSHNYCPNCGARMESGVKE